ncbi:MAG: HD domain-containing protein [Patescibacteria group bacterium]|nr:HD domain-containing protein [Patescibacteria group bacterium]
MEIPNLERRQVYLDPVRKIIENDIFLRWVREQLDLISDEGDTLRHTQRMTNCGYLLIRHLAREQKLSNDDIELFVETCLSHDLGKIEVDYKSLIKTSGKFSPEDFEIVKQHVEKGYDILKHCGRSDEVYNPVLIHHTFQPDPYPPLAIKRKKNMNERDKRNGRLLAMTDVFETCAFGRKFVEIRPLPLDKAPEAVWPARRRGDY